MICFTHERENCGYPSCAADEGPVARSRRLEVELRDALRELAAAKEEIKRLRLTPVGAR